MEEWSDEGAFMGLGGTQPQVKDQHDMRVYSLWAPLPAEEPPKACFLYTLTMNVARQARCSLALASDLSDAMMIEGRAGLFYWKRHPQPAGRPVACGPKQMV